MKWLLLTCLLIVGCEATAHAQNSAASGPQLSLTATSTNARSAQDDPVAKALEQAINRLAVAEEKNRLLEDRLAAKDAIITAKDGVIAVRDQQLELALSANKDRAGANAIDQFRIEACQQQLMKADAEIARLRNPGFLKSLFDVKSISGAVVGFGVGRLTK